MRAVLAFLKFVFFSKKLPNIKLSKIVAGAAFERLRDGHFVRQIMRAVLAFLRFAFLNVSKNIKNRSGSWILAGSGTVAIWVRGREYVDFAFVFFFIQVFGNCKNRSGSWNSAATWTVSFRILT